MRLALAEAVLAVHFLWIVWLIAGLPVGLWLGWPRLRILHAASMAATLGMQVAGLLCPLTIIEEWLRGGPVYGGAWLMNWLGRLVYLPVPPSLVMAATALWVAATFASFVMVPLSTRQCTCAPPSAPAKERC